MSVEMHTILYLWLLAVCCRYCYWMGDKEMDEKDKRIAELEKKLNELL